MSLGTLMQFERQRELRSLSLRASVMFRYVDSSLNASENYESLEI